MLSIHEAHYSVLLLYGFFLSFSFGQQLPCSLPLLILKGLLQPGKEMEAVGGEKVAWRYWREAFRCRL